MTDKPKPPPKGPDGDSAPYDPTGDTTPAPATGRKSLNPIFGTSCQTQTYGLRAYHRGHYHIHLEAVMDDPVKKTWSVHKVVHTSDTGYTIFPTAQNTKNYVHKLKSGVPFHQALETLTDFERSCKSRPNDFAVQTPEAAEMGFDHFRAFAEREGYVFDTQGKPHARPNSKMLPAGAIFAQTDVNNANRHLARPDNEFDNNGPASKTPNTHFLFEQFTKATHRQTLQERLTQLRVLDILDHFIDQVKDAHTHLQEYCTHYQELGRGGLITDAEDSLRLAGVSLRQLKAYGIDTTVFENFVLQCEITCHVLHAEGLYDLMNTRQGDFAQNETLFKERVAKALEAFSKIDNSDRGLQTLQDMIVQTPKPAVPYSITRFIENYDTQKNAFRPLNRPGAQNPPPSNKKPPFTP